MEYPNINWKNKFNRDIQLCILIYSHRLDCYKQLEILESLLDKKTLDLKTISSYIELSILNQLGFEELNHYNIHQKFKGVHPLIKHENEIINLQRLKENFPEEFLQSYQRTKQYVSRYRSQINTNKNIENAKKKLNEYIELQKLHENILKGTEKTSK
jgi:hypothetical protein